VKNWTIKIHFICTKCFETHIILLLIATIAVARWYLEPEAPEANRVATVSDVKSQISARNWGTIGEEKNDDAWEDEQVVEAILPGKVVADTQDGSVDGTSLPESWETYTVSEGSTVNWLGKKVWGQHNWFINISEGVLKVQDGRILGWNFVLDMTSIKATDIDSPKLDDTLKEWFNVSEAPEATFTLLEATPTAVVGILTLNNISKEISFPATVIVEEDTIIANAEFALDRNEWDVAEGTPAVSEFMELDFALTWTK